MHSHRIACIAQYVQVDMKDCLVRGEILDTKSRAVRHQAGEVCRLHVLRSINAGHSNGDGHREDDAGPISRDKNSAGRRMSLQDLNHTTYLRYLVGKQLQGRHRQYIAASADTNPGFTALLLLLLQWYASKLYLYSQPKVMRVPPTGQLEWRI